MGDFTGLVRSSMERDLREKSQSDERSISQGIGGGQWTSTKVILYSFIFPSFKIKI
jgi:hypothetical protein